MHRSHAELRIAEGPQVLQTPTGVYMPSAHCAASTALSVICTFVHVFLTTLQTGHTSKFQTFFISGIHSLVWNAAFSISRCKF